MKRILAFNSLYWVHEAWYSGYTRRQWILSIPFIGFLTFIFFKPKSSFALSIPFIGFTISARLGWKEIHHNLSIPFIGFKYVQLFSLQSFFYHFQFPLLGSDVHVWGFQLILDLAFNSLYWVLFENTLVDESMTNAFQFPLLGSWAIIFQSIYHAFNLSIPFIGFDVIIFSDNWKLPELSIPFIGFQL